MSNQDLLKRLALIKAKPELAQMLPQEQLISMMVDFVKAFQALQKAIETNKLKGDKGEDAKPLVAGKDYPSFEQIDTVLTTSLQQYATEYKKFQEQVNAVVTKASELKDGKDAEITEELKEEIASIALSLIELPDFDFLVSTEITRNSEAIRDALELLQGDERLDASAIKGLENFIKTVYVNGSGGIGKSQVYNFIAQAVADGTIPAGSGSSITIEDEGTDLPQRDTINFTGAGVTVTDAGGKTVVTIPGGGPGAVDSVNGQTGVVVLDADDIDDTSTAHKFATATQLTKVDNISITQPVDLDVLETASHAAITLAGTPDYITISGQTITRNQIDLATDVTGDLPFANLTQLSAHQVLGRAGSGTGDVAGITAGNDTILARSGSGNVDFQTPATIRTMLNVADGATAYTNENAQDAVGTILTDTTSIDLIYDDAGNTISAQREALTGAITAPKNSNTTSLGSFTLAQLNAAVSDADVANATHTHAIADVTGLQTALDGKAPTSHTHTASQITDFATAVAATAAVTANTAKVTNATHIGEVTGATTLTIANDVVTNAKLANVATATFKGRTTAGTGDPEDLTATQATALLNTFTSGAKGLAPASGGGTTNFLRADGTWVAPPGGGGGSSDEMIKAIAQTGHGFVVGDIIRHNGTAYTKSQGNNGANAEIVGMVSGVTDANNFTFSMPGSYIEGLSGRTAGETYFLDPTTAGAMTITEPTTAGQIRRPVFFAVSTTAGVFNPLLGIVITDAGEPGGGGGGGDDVISVVFDGQGATPTVGSKAYFHCPYGATITGWTIYGYDASDAPVSGSAVIDVWKDTYANYPATVADTIAGTEKPTLSSVNKNQDLTLSSWTTTIDNGDHLVFNLDSVTTCTKVRVFIHITKT